MRIISGKLKGKKFEFFKTSSTRPIKDSVKENIFNILIHSNQININIKDSKVLDLYSGFGSFGLECISRFANKVTFMEKDKKVVDVIKKNLKNLSIENKARIIEGDINYNLKEFKKSKFNIFFIDPPYADNSYLANLEIIKNKRYFSKNHIVIIHREKKSKENLQFLLDVLIIKKYGRSKIIFGKFN